MPVFSVFHLVFSPPPPPPDSPVSEENSEFSPNRCIKEQVLSIDPGLKNIETEINAFFLSACKLLTTAVRSRSDSQSHSSFKVRISVIGHDSPAEAAVVMPRLPVVAMESLLTRKCWSHL